MQTLLRLVTGDGVGDWVGDVMGLLSWVLAWGGKSVSTDAGVLSLPQRRVAFSPVLSIPERWRLGCTCLLASAPAGPGCSTYSGSTAPQEGSGGAGGRWVHSAASQPHQGLKESPLGRDDSSSIARALRRDAAALQLRTLPYNTPFVLFLLLKTPPPRPGQNLSLLSQFTSESDDF